MQNLVNDMIIINEKAGGLEVEIVGSESKISLITGRLSDEFSNCCVRPSRTKRPRLTPAGDVLGEDAPLAEEDARGSWASDRLGNAPMAAVAGLYGLGDDQRARHRRGQANADRSDSRDDNTEQ
ncbi:hypothetical protein EVAR_70737_1 [Eumeta japonica]|uniref:Uncharacterized protein n=1 Tax=Eumeta variegata TaxID=151549 RepID=A0A4C1TAY8_EUMVA|nr:hypothetical protein EVAR_70737_1 [Eumeta japonica]